jgi:hypothetical protein
MPIIKVNFFYLPYSGKYKTVIAVEDLRVIQL